MENHYQWMFVAGSMICKWAMFQFAMLVITRRYNKKLKDEFLSIQIWEISPWELEKKERVIRANLHVFRSSEWEAMMKHGMIWIMSLKKTKQKTA